MTGQMGRRDGMAMAGIGGLISMLFLVAACLPTTPVGPTASPATASPAASDVPSVPPEPTGAPEPTPTPPLGGTELYGFLPYWQMTAPITDYLGSVPLTTVALFSVAVGDDGRLKTGELGYRRIVGDRGTALVAAARRAGMRVDLVFTSFGTGRNRSFLSDPAAIARATGALAGLVERLGLDGLNVDVELARGEELDGYAELLLGLGDALRADRSGRKLSVATTAGHSGAAMARAAIAAGVDRVFLMGYDYHWSGSRAGASAPLDRDDGGKDLAWSIDEYVRMGVPRDRILLGLPLYGMSWPVASITQRRESTGTGVTWTPAKATEVLLAPGFVAGYDPLEVVQYFVRPVGDGWWVTYYDSPATLRPKLALARVAGLAGAGFWAVGYERGLPGYAELMAAFREGRIGPADAIVGTGP